MSKNGMIIGGMIAAMVGVGIASGSFTPIAYGASEATTETVGSGTLGTIMAIAGSLFSVFKLFTGAPPTSITNAVDLLRPVLSGQTNLPQGAVRVAFVILEADAVIRKNADDYTATQALAKRFLLPPETK